jgi:hypothetical protein
MLSIALSLLLVIASAAIYVLHHDKKLLLRKLAETENQRDEVRAAINFWRDLSQRDGIAHGTIVPDCFELVEWYKRIRVKMYLDGLLKRPVA